MPAEYAEKLNITLYLPGEDYNWFHAVFYYEAREGVSLLQISSKYEDGGYFVIESKYIDEIFALLEHRQ